MSQPSMIAPKPGNNIGSRLVQILAANNQNGLNSNAITGDNLNKKDGQNVVEENPFVVEMRAFLANAPRLWTGINDPPVRKYKLGNGDEISCVYWRGRFFITGTDVVKALAFRFQQLGRGILNPKKFEEGVFSDLRNLKPGTDAVLEEPRSEFLEFLHKNSCIRTQKKQKVFFWHKVPHDDLFREALERNLKRVTNVFNWTNMMNSNEMLKQYMLMQSVANIPQSIFTPFSSTQNHTGGANLMMMPNRIGGGAQQIGTGSLFGGGYVDGQQSMLFNDSIFKDNNKQRIECSPPSPISAPNYVHPAKRANCDVDNSGHELSINCIEPQCLLEKQSSKNILDDFSAAEEINKTYFTANPAHFEHIYGGDRVFDETILFQKNPSMREHVNDESCQNISYEFLDLPSSISPTTYLDLNFEQQNGCSAIFSDDNDVDLDLVDVFKTEAVNDHVVIIEGHEKSGGAQRKTQINYKENSDIDMNMKLSSNSFEKEFSPNLIIDPLLTSVGSSKMNKDQLGRKYMDFNASGINELISWEKMGPVDGLIIVGGGKSCPMSPVPGNMMDDGLSRRLEISPFFQVSQGNCDMDPWISTAAWNVGDCPE